MSYLRYVKVIGTMHVSPESRERVRKIILGEKPHAVAIELDRRRFYAIRNPQKMAFGDAMKYGRKGIIQYILTKVEEKLGEEFGMIPGGEMMEAINLAGLLGVPLYLIDEDINIITMKILKAPFREKLLLLLESLAVFIPLPLKREEKDIIMDFKVMMTQFKMRYPYLYRVLVEERNEIMARNLIAIVDSLKAKGIKKPKVIAVVGLGHKKGIERILNSHKAFISPR
ncbi:TraB domain-containing protein [Thermococcus paralvinellae]|uniref:Signaling protein, TraB family n=1 Tax=Thermococcus paralvinellae TaxID=582419 RepID=W0I570_9EURY|nr:TraB/GumN family protein [Thermococcus paralvinellae]AHF79523.1 signaling protein, TraB family [Thermococcus paralvinellae]